MPANSARYIDGLTREFTVRLGGADEVSPVYAAIAGTTCADPLDCVALTADEAHAVGMAWASRRCIMLATDRTKLFDVIPLPAGWSND